ncbi:MAG TPA: DedA family protein [Terriglobales bacterium]|nr:DedA family protein [Terriglobales bacterium]
MGHSVSHLVRTFVADYGYWAVALMLFGENAGLPVPGETTLLVASFFAYSEHKLHLGWIIVVATCAATLGDNLGFAAGFYGGRPLLERYQSLLRVPRQFFERGETLFARYGAATIFFARFVFGMRVIAGPLAGTLRMRWRTFTIFNFLGALVWVSCIAAAGFLFGQHWRALARTVTRVNVAVVVVVIAVIVYVWWRQRRPAST